MNISANKHIKIGVCYILIFNLLSGIQGVYLSELLQNVNLFATIAITFFFVSMFFIIALPFKKPQSYHKSRTVNLKNIIGLNIATAGSWIGFFTALKYIEPAVVSALANAVGPLLTLFITVLIIKSDKLTRGQILSALGVLFFMLLIINSTMSHSITTEAFVFTNSIFGVIMAIVCGLSMVMNTIFSKKLNEEGVLPHEIMAFRFILIIVVSGAAAGFDTLIETIQDYGFPLLLVAFLGNVIPLYFLQLGISKVPPLIVSNCLVIAPLFYFLLQQFSERISFSVETLFCILGSLICIISSIITKSTDKNAKQQSQKLSISKSN